MICPKCKSYTRVVNSRPHRDDPTVIQRRRWCDDCGHKFNTQEGTVDIVRQRSRKRIHGRGVRDALSPAARAEMAAKRDERRIRQHLRETRIIAPVIPNP